MLSCTVALNRIGGILALGAALVAVLFAAEGLRAAADYLSP
ncbi:MAG TPA: hypothetical protein VIV56_17115 [Gemmatimonadales bacterium]